MSRSGARWGVVDVALARAPRERVASALRSIGASTGRGEPVCPTEGGA
jgi:hypothetical protein